MKGWSEQSRLLLETTFDLASRREKREVEVYVLSVRNASAPGFRPTALPKSGYSSYGPDKVEAINVTLDALIHSWLEYVVKRPVVDETGLSGGFDVELKWNTDEEMPPEPSKIVEIVREQMGLDLTLSKRSLEVVIVGKRQP